MKDQSEPILFTTRLHWASFIDRGLLPHVVIIIVSRWLDLNLHHNELLGFALPWRQNDVNAVLNLISLLALLWLAFTLLSRWLNWSFNALYVTPTQFIYRLWPVSEDRISLGAIQDISIRKGGFGLFLGYGTLIIHSGWTAEILTFIPDVDYVASQLRPYYGQARQTNAQTLAAVRR